MTKVVKLVIINAPREAIRPYFDETARFLKWQTNVYRWEPEAAWPNPGAKNEIGFETTGLRVEGVATALEYDPASMHMVYQVDSSDLGPSTWEYTFEEHGNRTIVTAKVLYTVAERLLDGEMEKVTVERANAQLLEDALKTLKQQVEGSA